tara:strand:- start:1548 stop:2384 length:837 start_codon:yes stop_codon:yes gene_type:complete
MKKKYTIKSTHSFFDIKINEIFSYKDLIVLFIKRDFTVFYKQTILGPAWYIIQPILYSLVFTVIFGNFAKIPTDGLPPFIFYLSGMVIWGFFSSNLQNSSNIFNSNKSIFEKVYFPRIIAPISATILSIFQFFIQLIIFLCFYFYFYFNGSELKISVYIFVVPLLVVQASFLSIGFGCLISSLVTKYRDLTFLMGFFIQIWMYLSPIVYPLSQVPENYKIFYFLNPMVSIIELFKLAFFSVSSINMTAIIFSLISTIIIALLGFVMFIKTEKNFMDTV